MNRVQKWNENYNLCKKYYEEHGHLYIPVNYKIGDCNIYAWLKRQKRNNREGFLSDEQKRLLDELGIVWNSSLRISVTEFIKLAKDFLNAGGDFSLINSHTIYSGYKLGKITNLIIEKYYNKELLVEEIEALKSIGFSFVPRNWEQKYNIAKSYYEEYGNLQLKPNQLYKDFDLGYWLIQQKKNYSANQLSKKNIELLENIGIVWNSYIHVWERNYNEAKRFYIEHNHLIVPSINKELWEFLHHMRYLKSKNKLSGEKIALLNAINMPWNVIDYKWNKIYLLCLEYFNCHNNINLPTDYIVDGVNLTNWVNKQIKKMYKGELSDEKIEKLLRLGISNQPKVTKEEVWANKYLLAKAYYEKYGNLRIPRWYTVDGVKLGQWVASQRYRKEDLSSEKKDKLDKIGMEWTLAKKTPWFETYQIALEYYSKYNTINIKQTVKYNGFGLGDWIDKQKRDYKNNNLSDEQINLLNQLGIKWSYLPNDERWYIKFKKLKEFYENNHHLNIAVKENEVLYSWLEYQRKLYENNMLSEEKIDLLNSISSSWMEKGIKNKWIVNYNRAKEFYNTYHHLNITSKDDKLLYTWLEHQRKLYNEQLLSIEKIKLLNKIGMIWNYEKYLMINRKITDYNYKCKQLELLKLLEKRLKTYKSNYEFNSIEDIKTIEQDYTRVLFDYKK